MCYRLNGCVQEGGARQKPQQTGQGGPGEVEVLERECVPHDRQKPRVCRNPHPVREQERGLLVLKAYGRTRPAALLARACWTWQGCLTESSQLRQR